MKTATLKVLIPFHDMENNGKKRVKNEEFECTEKRAIEILKHEITLVKVLSIIKTKTI